MNLIKRIICIFIILLLNACAVQPINFKPGLQPELIELCLDFSREFSGDDKLLHLNAVNTFIDKFNANKLDFQIQSCANQKNHTVNLVIQRTRFVTPAQQAFYTIISAIGIAYPLSGGSFGFIWIGGNTTNLSVNLSDDIATDEKVVYRHFSSSPYFMSTESVKEKHMEKFQEFLFELFEELQNSEKKP